MTTITPDVIDRALARIPFKAGDTVQVGGKLGTVAYVYYNGFILVDFGKPIEGGIFSNNSTYPVAQVTMAN